MIAVILAGGYARRLWPLTREVAKPLLPVGGRRVIDYIMDKLRGLEEVGEVIVLTNFRFKRDFEKWAEQYAEVNLRLAYDSSRCEEEKPGAVKALSDVASEIRDDCLVIAGDNLFTDDLKGILEGYRRRGTATIGLYDVGDLELARNYAVVQVDEELRIISIEEKPAHPKSSLVSTGIYVFPERVLPKLSEYLEEGYCPDDLGRFLEWLLRSEPLYGYILSGEWYDIGTMETYRRALESFSRNG
ncbi:MAG TPA: nucleotidyltransferase family protein [Nitrososphaeria archaeon]|nr:nucleotidyltransferase family protein [Nitrososphaeria archaeon]